ncbi:NAD(P)/FAD-dependent oxidoreductase [Hydrogenobaculum acidophilum]
MIIIVGNGPAAVSAVEAIRSVDKDVPVKIFSSEPFPAYAPNCMENVVREDISEEALFFKGGFQFYKKYNVEFVPNTPIEEIDPISKIVKAKNGETYKYDKCLVAIGAYSFIPPIEGVGLEGVYSAKSLSDVYKIKDYMKNNEIRDIVIVGAGPIGVEDAQTLLHMGYNVHVIEIFDRILPRMLDHQMSYIYQQALEKDGIKFYTGHQLLAIRGKDGKVDSVLVKSLSKDSTFEIKAKMVIMSVGVRPSINIVKNVDVHKEKDRIVGGILTNEHQETSMSDLYAAGDICSSVDIWGHHRWIALFPAAVQEGYVAGFNMVGKKVINTGSVDYNAVKTKKVTAGSGGLFEDADKALTFEKDGVFFKIFIKNDMVYGYQFVGHKSPLKLNPKNRFLTPKNINMGGLGLESSGILIHHFMRTKRPLTRFDIESIKLGNLRALSNPSQDIPLWV